MFSAFHMSWTSLPLSSQDLWQSVEGRGEDGRKASTLNLTTSEMPLRSQECKSRFFFSNIFTCYRILQTSWYVWTFKGVNIDAKSEEKSINETVIDTMEPVNVSQWVRSWIKRDMTSYLSIVLNSFWHKNRKRKRGWAIYLLGRLVRCLGAGQRTNR